MNKNLLKLDLFNNYSQDGIKLLNEANNLKFALFNDLLIYFKNDQNELKLFKINIYDFDARFEFEFEIFNKIKLLLNNFSDLYFNESIINNNNLCKILLNYIYDDTLIEVQKIINAK